MKLSAQAKRPAPALPRGRRAARYAWALLLARIYDCLPLVCPRCGRAMRIVAFVTAAASVRRILAHVGEPTRPPPVMPARVARQEDFAWGQDGHEEFDQRTPWSEEAW